MEQSHTALLFLFYGHFVNIILLNPEQINQDAHTAILSQAQSQHVIEVLKSDKGDTIKIGELGGCLGTAQIANIDNKVVYLCNLSLNASPPPKLDVTVILALPRPKVLRRLIIDMTAIGVNQIILMNSYRTDKSYWGSPLLAKIDDFIDEGLQQGADTIPPNVLFKKRFKPFVEDELPNLMGDKIVFHPYADVAVGQYHQKHPLPKVVIIGAEGGFIEYEIELLKSVGVLPVSLGRRILRTESAVNAVLGRWLA